MLTNITMGWLDIHNFYMLATCQLRSFNAPTYSQSVLRLHYWKHEFFPCIQTIFFLFLLAIKKILLIRLQVSHNTQHSRSVITRNICIKFRVLKVTRQTFGLCLTPACPIFKAENFFLWKLSWTRKLCQKVWHSEWLCSQRNIFIPQENVKIQEWKKFPFQVVNTLICLSLSALLFITISFSRKSCH